MPSITSPTFALGRSRASSYTVLMDAPGNYAEGMAQATLILLLRSGMVSDADVSSLAEEYDRRAGWEPDLDLKQALEQTAHGLRLALLGIDPAPAIDPATEHRAQFQRSQMRQRTRWLERQAKEDSQC